MDNYHAAGRLSFLINRIPGIPCNGIHKPPDFPVLEYHDTGVRDDQDPVVRHRFLPNGSTDNEVVRVQIDVTTFRCGPVIRRTAICVPDTDLPVIIAVIMPVLLEEFVAGEHVR
jgi:hypothetical protein